MSNADECLVSLSLIESLVVGELRRDTFASVLEQTAKVEEYIKSTLPELPKPPLQSMTCNGKTYSIGQNVLVPSKHHCWIIKTKGKIEFVFPEGDPEPYVQVVIEHNENPHRFGISKIEII